MKQDARKTIQDELKRSRKSRLISLVVLMAILVGYTLWRSGGADTLRMKWDEDSLTVTDPAGGSYTLSYGDILSVEFRGDWDNGECVDGGSTRFYHYGTWRNELVGEYRLYAAVGLNGYMVLTTESETVAISYESDETTRALTDSIVQLLAERGYLS